MGNMFHRKTLKEELREQQRLINRAVRELEREIRNLESAEKKLVSDIKKMAQAGQMSTVRVMAKDLVRTKNHITRFIEMKTHLSGVGLKLQTIKSHEAMASAMKGVTKAMVRMNKQINAPQLQRIMNEFARENERAEMMQETMGDAIDDALDEPGAEEEEDQVVNQVLDEIGINMSEAVPEAPMGDARIGNEQKEAEEQPDEAMEELEARLNNLRRT